MLCAFQADAAAPLAERLVRALEAGLAAGGEHAPVRSAHLLVVERESFPLIDLRVDWHDAPIAELRSIRRSHWTASPGSRAASATGCAQCSMWDARADGGPAREL